MKCIVNQNSKKHSEYLSFTYNEIAQNMLENMIGTPGIVRVKKTDYLILHCGFDIETTTLNETTAWCYIWQFGILNDASIQHVIKGRYLEDFISLINMFYNICNDYKSHLIIWVANLSHEFQWIKKLIHYTGGFFKDRGKPFYIIHRGLIEFREALTFNGNSLKKLAENVCNTQKCVGDLDYSVIRTPSTELSPLEESYCDNDVIILSEFSKWFFDKWILPYNYIPVSIQNVIRHDIKQRSLSGFYKNTKQLKRTIQTALPSEELYNFFMKWVFRGGYCHGNIKYTGILLKEDMQIGSWDFTSSYPAKMEHAYYPYKFRAVEFNEKYLKTHCVIMYVTFYNVTNKTNHSIESKSKCINLINPLIDNGRILKAKEMTVAITELDYDIYTKFYHWDKMTVHKCWIASKIKLPRYILENMEQYYTLKNELKNNGQDYAFEKSVVNSHYGVLITRAVLQNLELNTDTFDYDVIDNDTWYDKLSNSPLLPQWGIYITAHARHSLLNTVYEIETSPTNSEVLYCDTDSIKVTYYHECKYIFDKYNEKIYNINKKICEKNNLNYEHYRDLGAFDFEGELFKLKYLGAKRYIYVHYNKKKNKKEIMQTVAGLGKTTLYEMSQKAHLHNKRYNIFKEFTNHMFISENKILMKPLETAVDIMYNGEHIFSESGFATTYSDFTMKIDATWLELYTNYIETLSYKEKR